MKNTKDNIHAGHRERFREQIKNSMYELNDIHFLEYLMQFVIPRGDTNPIAHDLISEFGSIDNIFEATFEGLTSIKGIGEKSARFLEFMPVICYMYEKSKLMKRPFVGTLNTLVPFIKKILPPTKNEQFIVLIVGKNYMVKHYKIFKGISHSFINFDSKELTEYMVKHKSSFCILAHTHPESTALPSNSDNKTFKTITPLFNALGIQIIDNLIIGEKNIFSYKLETLKTYEELYDLASSRKYDLNAKFPEYEVQDD